ncbi:MAG: efflux RND transporter periplasmic adaptor subunit [Deltaproteobacteria bacterium]|nr:efflux RND transporter periplasmic adaptor subunit [Deltaproteobacteria bacterium]
MGNKRFWVIIIILVAIGLSSGVVVTKYFLGNYLPNLTDIGKLWQKESPTSKKEERKILFYRHPMNPSITSPTPQKDEMGMDYIPVYQEETVMEEVPGTVTISPEKIQKIGVKTEEAKRRTLKRTIRTVGRIDHDESRVFNINTKIAGWVERLYVNKTDQMVHPGEPLLKLYSPELVATQEEYLLAIRNKERVKDSPYEEIVKGADSLIETARARLKYWDISEEQIERLGKEKKITRTMTIYAPSHGIVTEKMVNEGQRIEPGEMLFKIIDHSHVWVYGEVYEYELPFIRVGQMARIIPSYTPTEVYTATINHIYTHFGTVRHEAENRMEESRTAKIRFDLPNPAHKLKLGMYVNIELKVDAATNAVTVPDSAVIDTGARQVVIVDKGDGRFEPRDVKVGAQADGYYQILTGVKAGERVVTSANFLIDSESNLKAAIIGMAGHQHGEAKKEDTAEHKGH